MPLSLAALLALSCAPKTSPDPLPDAQAEAQQESERCAVFAKQSDDRMRAALIAAETAAWASETNITPETEAAATAAMGELIALETELVEPARACLDADTDPVSARIIYLLSRGGGLPQPPDPNEAGELARLGTQMSSHYGTAKVCEGEDCQTLDELYELMGSSQDPDALLDAWTGWHNTAAPQRERYQRFVELGNKGADRLGFDDVGAIWRASYEMPPDEFVVEMDRLWGQVQPLYEQLHCYVRAELHEQHGDLVPESGPIPAHLLGNMWAQDWSNLYGRMVPYPNEPAINVTPAIVAQEWQPEQMVKTAEDFFTSMGLVPLPATFWERSMFERPEDREVVCHASAWDPSYNGDARIKMCIQPTMEDLLVIHHELGHDYYYLYYNQLPALFQQGAHDGFHEAIGDTLLLSATPTYFAQLGLLEEASDSPEALINKQLLDAMGRVAFLPFGLLVDRWRWAVFSGEIAPDSYNAGWWELRERYQGVAAPVARTEADFDPGAKYHIPANTPYSRYFLSSILQYQLHQGLCEASGHTGPLHGCSVYGSQEAGQRLSAMLSLGASQPWPDALESVTGTRTMDGQALVEYFNPLMGWLQEQNQGRSCGW